ncbi:MAG: NUDIX domain-containing protein [Chloroflexota bacterium]
MAKQIASTVVLDETRQRILLQKREDFRLWALPGGHVDAGETPEEAAIREAYEETGLQVSITRKVAVFERPQVNETVHVYECRVAGGKIVKRGTETVDVDWFPVDALPSPRSEAIHQHLSAALADHPETIHETLTYPRWFIVVRAIAISLRNLRNRILRR